MNVLEIMMGVPRCAQMKLVVTSVPVKKAIAWQVMGMVVGTLMNVLRKQTVVLKHVLTLLEATPALVT